MRLSHADRFQQFLLSGEKLWGVEGSEGLSGTHRLTREINVQALDASAYMGCLRLQATLVRYDLAV